MSKKPHGLIGVLRKAGLIEVEESTEETPPPVAAATASRSPRQLGLRPASSLRAGSRLLGPIKCHP